MSIPLAKSENRIDELTPADFSASLDEARAHVRIFSRIEELPEPFVRLCEEAGRQSVFLTLPWFKNFSETALHKGDYLRIYGVASGDLEYTADGLMLMRGSSDPKGFFSPRKLEALANYYSCFFAPHLGASAADARATLGTITRSIARDKPRWDAIEIKPLDVNSEMFSMFVQAFKDAGFVVQTYFCA